MIGRQPLLPLSDDLEKMVKGVMSSVRKRTLLGPERLKNAARCVIDVNERNITGDIVECGTYLGGALAVMAKMHEKTVTDKVRTIWGFDTFAGIPLPSKKDGERASPRGHSNDLVATLEDCKKTLDLAGVDKKNVVLVKGLFQETLITTKEQISGIAVLRLDGDWYDSTMVCLEQLYDKVVVGGWIIIDDYGHWEGCKKAVDEFLASRELTPVMIATDYTERCWIKT